jgi:uncharacterized membrane protein
MTRLYWIVAVAIVVLAWGASLLLYPGLPARIPTHWNIRGQIDGYGPKGTVLLMPCVMVGLLGLFRLLPTLSPKNFEVDSSRATYLFVMVLVIGLQGYIQAVILYAVAHGGRVDMTRALFGGMFLFFALLGNVLGRVRRNFYIGVRVPWTLASERVWNDTHRVAAWVFVACGLAGFVIIIAGLPLFAAFATLLVAVFVPIIYSFVHYKQLERRGAL